MLEGEFSHVVTEMTESVTRDEKICENYFLQFGRANEVDNKKFNTKYNSYSINR